MNDKTKPEAQAAGLPWLLRERAQVAGVVTGELLNRAADALEALSTPASHDAQQPTNWLAELREGADYWREKCSILQQRLDALDAQQPAVVGDGVCAEADMQRPWGAESAFLRHLADDSALNAAQSMMLRHCAKRIESTAGIHLRALADMLDPAKQAGVLREAADAITPAATPGLHPATADLVARFSLALAEKLAAAERKYGYSDGWCSPDWMDECRQKLVAHVAKGDPRDVAAYCAFLWHHGESTAATPRPACPDCKGTGGEWWMEADGSENGRKCDTCDGFGSVAMPCSKCADLDRANKQLHDHGTAMYAQLTALRSALVEYPKKNPQQMQAAKVCAGVMKLAAQKEGNGNG